MPQFSPQLQDKIWEWPGNEARKLAWLECLDKHASVVLIGPSLVPRLSCVGGEPGNEAIDLSQNQNQPQCESLLVLRIILETIYMPDEVWGQD